MKQTPVTPKQTPVPPHTPKFAVFKCSDGRLQLVLKSIFIDRPPGNFFKIVNAGPLLAPYGFYLIVQRPFELIMGPVLKFCGWIRKRVLESRFGSSPAMQLRMEEFVFRANRMFGWMAITSTYGALRYAIAAKGVRNVIIVVHEACGAHEENLGPHAKDLWNRMIKRNAVDNMKKLNGMPQSKLVENWHLWFVCFSKRGIQSYDHASGTWVIQQLEDIERVVGEKLPATDTSDLFKEVWEVPVDHTCDDHH
jgi:carbonic anhydrase